MIKIREQDNLKDFILALLEVSYKISLACFMIVWTALIFYIILLKPNLSENLNNKTCYVGDKR